MRVLSLSIQKYTEVCKNILKNAKVYRLQNTGVQVLQGYTDINESMQEYTEIDTFNIFSFSLYFLQSVSRSDRSAECRSTLSPSFGRAAAFD